MPAEHMHKWLQNEHVSNQFKTWMDEWSESPHHTVLSETQEKKPDPNKRKNLDPPTPVKKQKVFGCLTWDDCSLPPWPRVLHRPGVERTPISSMAVSRNLGSGAGVL